MSQSLLPLNSSSLTGEYHAIIYTHLLSFVPQYIFEDISIFHTFFY